MIGKQELLFGHPKGLYVLFLTEMWERFSYYGMRALLVLYLTQHLLMTDAQGFAVYGTYTALVYISPLIGGMLADRYLGFTKSVVFGGILMLLGHTVLAISDLFPPADGHVTLSAINLAFEPASQLFYLSLALLVVGVGFLKPNISTMVGDLYPKNSYRRDSGFTIFVMGINFGAAVSAFVCGYLGQKYGWGYGFGLAGIGMGLGLAIFLLGQKHLRGIGDPPQPDILKERTRIGLTREHNIYLLSVLSIIPVWQVAQLAHIMSYFVAGSIVASVGGVLIYSIKYLEKREREQLFAALLLTSTWVFFAALLEQIGSSLNLFTERVVDRSIEVTGGSSEAVAVPAMDAVQGTSTYFEIQTAQFQGLLATFIILLAPIFAWLWGYLEKRHLNPSTPVKMSLSLVFLGVAYGLLTLGILSAGEDHQVNMVWLVLLYFFFAFADLFIAPVGLSAITRLSPARIVGFMMGVWMLAVAIGSYLAALIAQFSSLDPRLVRSSDPAAILANYQDYFGTLAIGSFCLGVFYLMLSPLISRWMHGVK